MYQNYKQGIEINFPSKYNEPAFIEYLFYVLDELSNEHTAIENTICSLDNITHTPTDSFEKLLESKLEELETFGDYVCGKLNLIDAFSEIDAAKKEFDEKIEHIVAKYEV